MAVYEYKYFWKSLTPKGTLEEPEIVALYHDNIPFVNNELGQGFDTETEAELYYLSLTDKFPTWELPENLVLIRKLHRIMQE